MIVFFNYVVIFFESKCLFYNVYILVVVLFFLMFLVVLVFYFIFVCLNLLFRVFGFFVGFLYMFLL